jgi:simple sugar transport system ATP-binding protein
VLGPREAQHLFVTLRRMAKRGLSLIFISHKLDEVLAAADRVLVLRAGRGVAERPTQGTTRGELAELMVGHRVVRPRRDAGNVGEVVLRCDAVELIDRGRRVLDHVSLEVRAGEVLAIVGVAGNGQASLGRLLSGHLPPRAGRIELLGRSRPRPEPRALVAAGVGRIPEDRLAEGVVGELDVAENVALERLGERRFARLGLLRRAAAVREAAQIIERFDVRGAGPRTAIRLLSGGNIQKLILGRNLSRAPRLLIANQPTRGLDEGAVAAVHADILRARSAGAGVLLVSEDLDEVLALADRVQAMVRGRLSAPIAAADADAQRLGLLLAGLPDEAERAA